MNKLKQNISKNSFYVYSFLNLTVLCFSLSLTACASDNAFRSIGSSVLSNVGLSGSQADAVMRAGESGAKGLRGFTEEEEYFLGRSVSAMILSKYPPLNNQALNMYVNRVGQAIASVSDRPETFNGYKFQLLDSNEVNALAAPGGYVFITSGMLRMLKNEDSLAAVLAHEVAHVVANDGVNAISKANFTQALSILGTEALNEAAAQHGGAAVGQLTDIFSSSVEDVFTTLVTNGYSRSQEYSADKYALELLKRAGYNPYALVTVMDDLKQVNGTGGIFATHPTPEDRKNEMAKVEQAGQEILAAQQIREKRFFKFTAKSLPGVAKSRPAS